VFSLRKLIDYRQEIRRGWNNIIVTKPNSKDFVQPFAPTKQLLAEFFEYDMLWFGFFLLTRMSDSSNGLPRYSARRYWRPAFNKTSVRQSVTPLSEDNLDKCIILFLGSNNETHAAQLTSRLFIQSTREIPPFDQWNEEEQDFGSAVRAVLRKYSIPMNSFELNYLEAQTPK
jgi:hypothetical protein